MEQILVSKIDEVYLRISTDTGIEKELSEFFKFRVPGFQFMPRYKMRVWDGYIRLYDSYHQRLYVGLLPYLKQFCKDRDYQLITDHTITPNTTFTELDAANFFQTLNLPFQSHDYQNRAITYGITNNRSLLVSPTGSGKSLIIYGLTRYYNKKTLIIVPTISLVSQMYSDFEDYAKQDPTFDVAKNVHKIYQGQEKVTNKQIVISTWQSIFKLPKKYFQEFDVVIGDEAHLIKAKSLTNIMEMLVNAKYRFGTTGTLDGTVTNKLVLEGLFGKCYQVTTTKKLMDAEKLAELRIECVVLKYPDSVCKAKKDYRYHDEVQYIIGHTPRNVFIRNLAISMKSNCLVTFQFVDSHGKVLYQMIKDKLAKTDPNRKVFFVAGETDGEYREEIRKITEKEKNAIIVASVGVFSTGINIRNLDNIIFTSPSKSRIRTLQSIGRVLRKGDNQSYATLYDIADDLSWKSHKNFALEHFLERIKLYNSEKFNYKMHKIELPSE